MNTRTEYNYIVVKKIQEEKKMAAQIAAVTIFLVMFLLIILEKFERHIITLGCAALTLILVFGVCMHSTSAVTETLNFAGIFTKNFWIVSGEASESTGGINWATIIFVAGMMIMVEGMAAAGFFRWLCMSIAKAVKYQVIPIFITFMIIFVASVIAISFEGHDLVTNFTAIAATINNIGPGLSMVGPDCNFGFFSDFSKLVIIFDMLAGRLELFPLLILFHPAIWKELFTQKITMRRKKKF